ncbi:hypothetical protein OK016_03145 [Vibrio chagasii]|nr:hypothetical protein [Vibrio chagasii]
MATAGSTPKAAGEQPSYSFKGIYYEVVANDFEVADHSIALQIELT